jgi:putative transposase
MSQGLVRIQNRQDLHFLTFSCFRHQPVIGTPAARNLLLQLLEETRQKYEFHVLGYVIMPEHVHLLLSEPETAKLSTAIQVLKQRFSRTRAEEYVWEPRYYDFNVFTERKRIEKLHYIHRNPVTRGLVAEPELWQWSSYRAYAHDERGAVLVTTL